MDISYISSLKKSSSLSTDKRRLVVLGSTGSIGKNVLDIVSQYKNIFEVIALGAGKNIKLLAEQILTFRPKVVALLSQDLIEEIKQLLPQDIKVLFLWGTRGYENIASMEDADIIVNAISGASGLRPTIASLKNSKIIALANKESLVLAGPIIRKMCQEYGAEILPVDSEHNAIFQCLAGHDFDDVSNLWLTASGGPFWNKDSSFLDFITPEMALKHPNWDMGAKITIDSATLMNKGLEVIEAHYLFGISLEQIKIVIHPQSIIHSMVEYKDGSFIGHLAIPDMKIPISFCLFYPKRLELGLKSLNLPDISKLEFYNPDNTKFPSIELAKKAVESGESYPIVLNAANEIAVSMFLKNKISFLEIFKIVQKALNKHSPMKIKEIEDVLYVDGITREMVKKWVA